MILRWCVPFCTFILFSLIDLRPIDAKISGSSHHHANPGRFSGRGNHEHLPSGETYKKISSSDTHSYPPHEGLSGGGSGHHHQGRHHHHHTLDEGSSGKPFRSRAHRIFFGGNHSQHNQDKLFKGKSEYKIKRSYQQSSAGVRQTYLSPSNAYGNVSSGNAYGNVSSGGSHSYPPSGSLSGGGSAQNYGGTYIHPVAGVNQGYPYPGGININNSSGSVSYPQSGRNTGGGSAQNYGGTYIHPVAGVTQGYPYPTGTYRNISGHSYPPSGGVSEGINGHKTKKNRTNTPASVSRNNQKQQFKEAKKTTYITNVHNHTYYYTPPKSIIYIPPGGGPTINYPVYRSQPPAYVYQIKDSGSKYERLLTGLALLSLGKLAEYENATGSYGRKYTTQPGEVCSFGVIQANGDTEETKIDCKLISGFILEAEAKALFNKTNLNTTKTVNIVTTPTLVPVNNPYIMLPNGTLVAAQNTANNFITSPVTNVTITTTNTTIHNALDVKGVPIPVNAMMKCYVKRTTQNTRMKNNFLCRLLQKVDGSIERNSAPRNGPVFSILAVVFFLKFIY